MRIPVTYRKVPRRSAIDAIHVARRIPLDLTAKEISHTERNFPVNALITNES